jgi:hypothetical protein
MNSVAWLKFVKHSTEAHHIREIFNGTYGLIGDPDVSKIFFNKIDALLDSRSIDKHTRDSLENLREDIEDEIETGKMRGAGNRERAPRQLAPISKTNRLKTMNRLIEAARDNLDRLEKMVEMMLNESSNL